MYYSENLKIHMKLLESKTLISLESKFYSQRDCRLFVSWNSILKGQK